MKVPRDSGKLFDSAPKDVAPKTAERVRHAAAAPDLKVLDLTDLLTPHETIRDPIQLDVWVTALERHLIDTPAFQRLRSISQLGPTSMVYPGATHNRFLHSIGTLAVLERLVGIANRNAQIYTAAQVKIEGYPHLLARLVALLHDVAHIPFGHTLEDEGGLFAPEWEDESRLEHWLGNDSVLGQVLRAFVTSAGHDDELALTVLADVRNCLSAKRDTFDQLPFPYVADLVGNTLCADLLDYLDRDMYYCGLQERSGERFVNYLSVLRLEKINQASKPTLYRVSDSEAAKSRVVLLAYRLEADHEIGASAPRLVKKWDVLSEALDLLRRRFSLAEKVYFHRTKRAASSMLISAVGASGIKPDELYDLTDEGVINKLAESKVARTKTLIDAYRNRDLYKPIYRLDYKEPSEHADAAKLWDEVYERFRNPTERLSTESELEQEMGLDPGTVSIYCPDREMNLKRFEMLVLVDPSGYVKPLGQILDRPKREEMDALNRRFEQLWGLEVFVRSSAVDPQQVMGGMAARCNGLCESIFQLPNDIHTLRGKGISRVELFAEQAIAEWDEKHPENLVPHSTHKELVAGRQRNPRSGQSWSGIPRTIEEMTEHLTDLMVPPEE